MLNFLSRLRAESAPAQPQVEGVALSDAMAVRRKNNAGSRYPGSDAARFNDGMLFPNLTPTFRIGDGRIFTVGSCFARNIEAMLIGRDVPTARFSLPEGEIAANVGNRILNEYNPGTMAQRIGNAATGGSFGSGALLETKGKYADLLLSGGVDLPLDRILERRGEIDTLYRNLVTSEVLIVTLGLVEAWYDRESQLYINRMPQGAARRPEVADRFELRVLDANTAYNLMAGALQKALGAGLKQVLLTVSPVPLQTTFTAQDVVMANSYSKATLRTVAARLEADFSEIDYFPSYEMVTSFAGNPFIEDNVHVRPEIVKRVTGYMMHNYTA